MFCDRCHSIRDIIQDVKGWERGRDNVSDRERDKKRNEVRKKMFILSFWFSQKQITTKVGGGFSKNKVTSNPSE